MGAVSLPRPLHEMYLFVCLLSVRWQLQLSDAEQCEPDMQGMKRRVKIAPVKFQVLQLQILTDGNPLLTLSGTFWRRCSIFKRKKTNKKDVSCWQSFSYAFALQRIPQRLQKTWKQGLGPPIEQGCLSLLKHWLRWRILSLHRIISPASL